MQMRKSKPEVSYGFKAGSGHASPASRKSIPLKIGIYNGSFDPVHTGHIIFALKAQKIAGLEHVYFMPERRPQDNTEAEHYVHRTAMLQRALAPYSQFSPIDLPDARFTARTIPRLQLEAPGAELSLLTTASQLLWHNGDWPKVYERLHMVIAVTSNEQLAEVLERVNASNLRFRNMTFVDIGTNHISSAAIRQGMRSGKKVHGLLPSVWRYARTQWLYISPHHH